MRIAAPATVQPCRRRRIAHAAAEFRRVAPHAAAQCARRMLALRERVAFRNRLTLPEPSNVDAFFASSSAALRNAKRLRTPISVRQPVKSASLLPDTPTIATIAAQQLSTISKTGTVLDVLDIYGLFHAVTFSRHFIF